MKFLNRDSENVPKNGGSSPDEDVIIVDCGEVGVQFSWTSPRLFLDS
jgi:hypothetical protein